MSYGMGVDLGTTWSAVAVTQDGRSRMVPLGMHTDEVPSLLAFQPDGSVLVGEAARRRAAREPHLVAREFKRRFGDPTPLLLGGVPRSPQLLTAELLRRLVAVAAERQGGAPDRVTVTHPANWGPYKRELFGQALRLAELDVGDVRTLTEPEAAALAYDAAGGVPADGTVAVYDLGGGTFDAAVVGRAADGGFTLLGPPEGVENLGGVDFDEAVFGHVRAALGRALAELDLQDPAVVAAIGRLRHDCVEAKEALSVDTVATIPGPLPGIPEVRLLRSEFEAMIRPALMETVAALRRALASAGVRPDDLSSVLLVGGSSRIPLVAEVVAEELGREVAVDAHPKHLVATGAALDAASGIPAGGDAAARGAVATGAGTTGAGTTGAGTTGATPTRAGPTEAGRAPARRRRAGGAGRPDEGGGAPRPPARRRRPALVAGGLAAAGAAAVAAVLLLPDGGDDGGGGSPPPGPPPAVEVVVDGTAAWTDTGIDVRAGEVVTIEAAGEVFHNEAASIGPEGFPNRPELLTPVPSLNHAGLLGRLDATEGMVGVQGPPFYVGRGTTFTADRDGRLHLGVNDGGLENNRGEFTATVTVTAA